MMQQNFGDGPYKSIFDTQEQSKDEAKLKQSVGSAKDILEKVTRGKHSKRRSLQLESDFARTENGEQTMTERRFRVRNNQQSKAFHSRR
mmetsp:Transcript_6739/g.8039  ORF Transcript_6739/g.8039 Transcript_6739/m.8039 type:complete len:89 (-) Transcript_6739:798-1064(-)